jgi:hypothetical protein
MKKTPIFRDWSQFAVDASALSVFIHVAFIFLLLLAVSLPFELITPLCNDRAIFHHQFGTAAVFDAGVYGRFPPF